MRSDDWRGKERREETIAEPAGGKKVRGKDGARDNYWREGRKEGRKIREGAVSDLKGGKRS